MAMGAAAEAAGTGSSSNRTLQTVATRAGNLQFACIHFQSANYTDLSFTAEAGCMPAAKGNYTITLPDTPKACLTAKL